jgi:hypothetical protein
VTVLFSPMSCRDDPSGAAQGTATDSRSRTSITFLRPRKAEGDKADAWRERMAQWPLPASDRRTPRPTSVSSAHGRSPGSRVFASLWPSRCDASVALTMEARRLQLRGQHRIWPKRPHRLPYWPRSCDPEHRERANVCATRAAVKCGGCVPLRLFLNEAVAAALLCAASHSAPAGLRMASRAFAAS